MATRSILRISELQAFEGFLESKGYMILATSKNPYEVLRAKKDGDTVIVYQKKDAKEHLSTMDKDYPLVREFIKSQRKQTNADKIRSMTDEELAEFYTTFSACKVCEYQDAERDTCGATTGFLCTQTYAEAIILDWLKSPAESEG
ncbi:hypothetical protein B5F53_11520 [Blautia sp. An249]|uniref:hypothetical protein n=1 Tax=Blautia sp. An249 TaxID=1965603 RepID=UPI000B383EFD|nr:hypothetical protein [Blautia sp. An249]OUO78170.1 hypothetical protein B5F53_11520 [Blautia sp. An249]